MNPPASPGLMQRIARGSVYMTGAAWSAQALNLAIQVALARLLGPAEFGVYAFCFAINELLTIVGAFSFDYALIQQRDESQSLYDTAFAACAVLGALGLAIALLLAPALWQLRSPESAQILVVMAGANLLRFLAQAPQASIERALRYRALSGLHLSASTIPNVIALGLAWWGLGAWSLVLRDVLVTAGLLGGVLLVSGYRYQGRQDRASLSVLLDFSRPMFVSRTLETLMERLDSVAVGSVLGNRAAGIYHWARFLADSGAIAMRPIERVSMNLYSRLHGDREHLSRAYSRVNRPLARLLFVGAAALIAAPEETTRLLLGDEWLEVAPLLRWLGLYAALLPLFHNAKVLLQGAGAVRALVRIRLIQLAIFTAGIAAAVAVDSLVGVAATVLIAVGSALALAWMQASRFADPAPFDLIGAPALALAITCALAFAAGGSGVLDSVPWMLHPILAPMLTLAILGLLERRRLWDDVNALWQQVRSGS